MAYFSQNWRITGSLILAAGLVLSAYFAARGAAHPPVAEASTETALLQAIATKDTDGDGLPDWEETLYGTNPNMVDTKGLGMTDGEAVAKGLIVPKAVADVPAAPAASGGASVSVDGVPAPAPGSMTDAFAQKFFNRFLIAQQAKGGTLTEQDTNDIAQQAIQELTASIAPSPDFKSMGDLKISGSGPDALRAFAIAAEAAFAAHTSDGTKGEILYLQDVVKNQDDSALFHITSIANRYHDSAVSLATLPVPQELAGVDLSLINALARIGEISNDFAKVKTDPLVTILAIAQYPQAVLNLGNAFIHTYEIYKTANVVLTNGSPGASFVNVIQDVSDSQKSESKTSQQ